MRIAVRFSSVSQTRLQLQALHNDGLLSLATDPGAAAFTPQVKVDDH